jgi:Zn-dependent protease
VTPELSAEQAVLVPQEPPGWNEELYQASTQLLVEPEASRSPWAGLGCLLLSLGLFVLSFFASLGLEALAFIIPVLFFHEAGHWVGMRLFGYRNVRMFFIPFFGAAVAGTKHAAPAWQQAVVLLLGPLPGIVLGLGLYLLLSPGPDDFLGKLALWLVILNGINLAPLVPLDGGRLLDVLLFSRRPWLAVAFRLLAVAGLAVFAWRSGSWILGLLAAGVLLSTPSRYQRARRERLFADNPQQFPEDLEQLDDAQKRDLFGWARLLNRGDGDPASLAGEMRTLHENMVTRQPGLLLWVLFIALYLGGIAGTIAGGVSMIPQTAAHSRR